MISERVERRVLAGVQAVDLTTGTPITTGIRIEGEGTWLPNLSGVWVLHDHPDFAEYVTSFAAPPAAPLRVLRPVVRCTDGRWQTRAFSLSLPRSAVGGDPALFRPLQVPLSPSASAGVRRGWAAVRVSVRLATGQVPVEGAVVRVLQGANLRAIAQTDRNGQALALVPAIPLFVAAGDGEAVTVPGVNHTLIVVLEPAAVDPDTGRRLPSAGAVDPDDVWSRRETLVQSEQNLSLSHATERVVAVELP